MARGRSRSEGVILAAPAVLGLSAFVGLPFVWSVALSFTNLRLGSPLPMELVGVEQYRRILTDPSFQRALLNNGLFALCVVPLQTGLALFLALLLAPKLRAMTFFRTLFFMPVVFPMSLVAVVWELIYAPGPTGLLNEILIRASGGAWTARDFLHDQVFALPAIVVLSIWQGVGFQMIILLAALQDVPEALHEAAQVDGANRWAEFRSVTLPEIEAPLVFTALVTSILAFRVYDQVQILTRGGPNNATITVMLIAVRTAFERLQVGQASAMTVIFFLIVLAITMLQRVTHREERR